MAWINQNQPNNDQSYNEDLDLSEDKMLDLMARESQYQFDSKITTDSKIRAGSKSLSRKRKIVMQTWKNTEVPEKWAKSPESISKHLPDWDYILMTDEDNRNFIAQHRPDFLPYYDAFPYPIQRADAIRYVWMAYTDPSKYDLVLYMDLDIELQGTLDPLFKGKMDHYFVGSGNLGGYQTNSMMAGRPGAQIWHDMIDEMKKPAPWWAFTKHFIVMASTGPIALSRVVARSTEVWGKLPGQLLMPCSVCDDRCISDVALATPLEGQSWCGWDSLALNMLLCNWKQIAIVLAVIVFIALLTLCLSMYRWIAQ